MLSNSARSVQTMKNNIDGSKQVLYEYGIADNLNSKSKFHRAIAESEAKSR